ncbi:hypothetical protein BOTCAL_0341g00070 [Botryotinia calthae]|uniref:Uncharacterized protein n=1 Tax=Botryotinia calthae TaxID=38488 RepID=A0A4Y8CSX9_9HELO|nr:hypothetical protein BOTCAL_0341g00070 [Botryotinia calthae]
MVPFGILGGFLIAKVGNYRLNRILGFALATIAIGCLSILDQNSSTAVCYITCNTSTVSSIFEAKFRSMIYTIDDENLEKVFRAGGAYEHASKAFITSLSEESRMKVVKPFVVSLKLVWEVGLAFAVFGLLASCFVQDIELRNNLETDFGYEEGTDATKTENSPVELMRF